MCCNVPLTGSLLVLELLCVLYFHPKIDMMPCFWFFFRQAWTVGCCYHHHHHQTTTTTKAPLAAKSKADFTAGHKFFNEKLNPQTSLEVSSFTTVVDDIHFHIFFIFYYILHILHNLLYYILILFPFWSIHCRMPGTEGWFQRTAIRKELPSGSHPSDTYFFFFWLLFVLVCYPARRRISALLPSSEDHDDMLPDKLGFSNIRGKKYNVWNCWWKFSIQFQFGKTLCHYYVKMDSHVW